MCGIAGAIDYYRKATTDLTDIYKMRDSLRHRGPDQEGVFEDDIASLAHTRLSVVDIKNGIQPMPSKSKYGAYWLVYNGELYNTDELRSQLISEGFSFHSHSDTEVILNSYIAWGEECVEKFNGIFAFAVWDSQKQSLFFCRDRIGVKPFFYHHGYGKFLFGSELKALLSRSDITPQIDANSIAEIMLIGPGRTPGYGVFKGISELPPATCGTFSRDGLKTRRYWTLTDKAHTESFEETMEHTRYLLDDAITRQLVSDVPVGTFLSGGLDSSIISAIAARELKEKGEVLQSFSVHYTDNEKYFKASKFQPNSDDFYIDRMTAFLNSRHRRIFIDTPQLVDALFDAVDARDLPGMADVDASLLLFCKEVKQHVTVALSGECADEIFGGYPWYRDEDIRMTDGFPWAQSTAFRTSFIKEELIQSIDPQDYVYSRYQGTITSTNKLPGLSPLESRMKEMTKLNLDWFMQTLLMRKDQMSMFGALEVRVPFCDYRIAEYLYSVPWEMKDYKGREKGLLREASIGLLPDDVLWRKKSPYPKTHNPNYLSAVSSLLEDVIADSSAPVLQILKRDKILSLLRGEEEVQWYGQLMSRPQTIAYLLQINYWMDKWNISIC